MRLEYRRVVCSTPTFFSRLSLEGRTNWMIGMSRVDWRAWSVSVGDVTANGGYEEQPAAPCPVH